MLQSLRSHTKGWLAGILFALLIASFALWGIGDIFRAPSATTTAIYVGDEEISSGHVFEAFERNLERFNQQVGTPLAREEALQMGLLDRTIDEVVSRSLLEQEARNIGLVVGDDLVRDEIFKEPGFRDEYGNFSRETFQQIISFQGFSEEAYIATTRRAFARRLFASSVGGGVTVPDPLRDLMYRYQNERRTIDLVRYKPESFANTGTPSTSELEAFYQENGFRFSRPEYRAVSVMVLDTDSVASEIKITEEELARAYEERQYQFFLPERRRYQQMILADETAAESARARLAEGESFASVARDLTGQDEEAIDLGWLDYGDLPAELQDPALALDKGEISAPVETPLGWHVLKLTDLEPERTRSFDEVKDELRQALARETAGARLYDLSNQVQDELAAGASLAEVARQLNLPLRKIPAVDVTGRNRDGEQIEDVPALPDFVSAAFGTEAGETSELIETEAGAYLILSVDEITPSVIPPLDGIRDEVRSAWRATRQMEKASAAAEDARSAIESGGATIRARAETDGRSVQTIRDLSRDAGEAGETDLPPSVLAGVFNMAEGETRVFEDRDGFLLVRLRDSFTAGFDASSETDKAVLRRLTSRLEADILAQLSEALGEQYGVEINREAVEALF
ncbi:MAG: peptidyl-prolyl cis-trans isomerase [Marinovum algicola]|uniref:peptidyl-prolyl cis-trans isomerase n=1 Tax=Marinovum algicola TaxID=42444 RepID=UPI0032EE56C7